METVRSILTPPSSSEIQVIYKELGFEKEKVENNIELLNEWLRCEQHLPDNVDDALLGNFLRGCKGNLEKTKVKVEKYLVAKTQLGYLFQNRLIIDEDYQSYHMHKCVLISSKYTPNGNRIITMKLPTADATYFDFIKIAKHAILTLEFILHNDIAAGYDFIYDATYTTGQILGKMNLTTTKHIFDIFYNILPIRTRSIFILNSNKFFEVPMAIARTFMPKKIKERVRNGRTEDLLKYYPKDCLPTEYGGNDNSIEAVGNELLRLFKSNEKWIQDVEAVKLTGPLPAHKKALYSFEEFNMDGSFRKLNID